MDAIELLEKDHRKVEKLFAQLEKIDEKNAAKREELFEQLKEELDLHAEVEETIFYPVLKEADKTREITMEGYEEHHVVKAILAEMESTDIESEQWTAKLTVLKENVEHHVEEEEGEMFKKAKKELSKDELKDLGERMAAAKQNPMAGKSGKSTKETRASR